MVAVEIFDAVLPLPILRFMQPLNNLGAGGLGSAIVLVNIFHEDGHTLRSITKSRWARLSWFRLPDHDAGTTEKHLRAGDWFPIAEVFGETEYASKPRNRIRKVLVSNVGEQNVGGH